MTWRWDIFCAVVDNYGDIGTCWRLAQQLAFQHQISVRLWIDNLERFALLCPSIETDVAIQKVGPIEVCCWEQSSFPQVETADVVVEGFACAIPPNYVAAMARRAKPPVWINLEYLSAESWVDECHGLPSPQSTPSLRKYFFFPGFTSKTGGLLREHDLLADRAAFGNAAEAEFWKSFCIETPHANELRISLFCYHNPSLPELLEAWAGGESAVRLLVSPGPAIDQIESWLGQPMMPDTVVRRNSLKIHPLPFLSQASYDRLLWASDINFVRGEDSFVRAQWAQRPFVWQVYPQSENTHLVKLDAFLGRYLDGFEHGESVGAMMRDWNSNDDVGDSWANYFENRQSILEHGRDWAKVLDRLGNLSDNLVRFVRERSFE